MVVVRLGRQGEMYCMSSSEGLSTYANYHNLGELLSNFKIGMFHMFPCIFYLTLTPIYSSACAANSAAYTLVGESCALRVRNKYMLLMTCFLLFSPAAAASKCWR